MSRLTVFPRSTFSALPINFHYVKIVNRTYILTKFSILPQNIVVCLFLRSLFGSSDKMMILFIQKRKLQINSPVCNNVFNR